MTTTDTVLSACFWASAAGVAYAYAGYPLAIYGLSRLVGKAPAAPEVHRDKLPSVSLLIVAHNEASAIEARLENALAMEYPRDRFEIVVASDGSDDATCEICRRYADRVRLTDFSHRRGKAGALAAAMALIHSDVVVLSDANTLMAADALQLLARWFADPKVGCVSGRLILTDPATGRNVDSTYWRYETFLKDCEGRLGALLGANGAIYAIRRSVFQPPPAGTIVDDFTIPLLAKLRSGCSIVYDGEAIAYEETPANLSAEFHRRTRIGIGAYQALMMLWPLLSPRHGWTAFTFSSHKVMRWLCPFMLIAALGASVMLIEHSLYRAILALQMVFYALACLGAILPPRAGDSRIFRIIAMFAGMNAALLVGFFRWLGRQQTGVWARTERGGASAG